MQIGLLFAAVGHCKKAYDAVNNMRKVPEDAYFLWQLLDAMQPTLELLTIRNSQEAQWRYVNKSIEVVYETLCECDVLLVRSEPDGRPSDALSWEEWWGTAPNKAKECATRVSLIPKLTQRLHHCIALMQLALSAASNSTCASTPLLLHSSSKGSSSGATQTDRLHFLLYPVSAMVRARGILHMFESGRLDGAAQLQYQVGQGALYKKRGGQLGAPWVELGHVGVVLRRCTSGSGEEAYEWLFVLSAGAAEPPLHGGDDHAVAAATSGPEVGRVKSGARLGRVAARLAFASDQPQWTLTVAPPSQHATGAPNAAARFVFAPNTKTTTTAENSVSYALEYTSCLAPSQHSFFPSADESYLHVTSEVAQLLFAFCAAMHRTASKSGNSSSSVVQVDAVLPVVVDEESTDEERMRVEKFVGEYVVVSAA